MNSHELSINDRESHIAFLARRKPHPDEMDILSVFRLQKKAVVPWNNCFYNKVSTNSIRFLAATYLEGACW